MYWGSHMNEQTKQLMLFGKEEEKETPVTVALPAHEVDRIKGRLRALADLKKHVGYSVLVEAFNDEAKRCLVMMDKAETPHKATQYGANYFSLTMAAGYVDNEIVRLRALLGIED